MKDYKNIIALFFCLLTGSSLPARSQSPSAPDADGRTKSIEKSNIEYFLAVGQQSSIAFKKQFTPDCWIMPQGSAMLCGPGAAADYFEELLSRGIISGRFITINLYGAEGSLCTEVGFYQLYGKGERQLDEGSYITIWKMGNGGWQRHRATMVSSRKQP